MKESYMAEFDKYNLSLRSAQLLVVSIENPFAGDKIEKDERL
jgi:hypothetical protein